MGIKLRCIKVGSPDFEKGKIYDVINGKIGGNINSDDNGYEYTNIKDFNIRMSSQFEVVEENKTMPQKEQERLCEIINSHKIESSHYCWGVNGEYFLKVNFYLEPTWSEWTEAKHKSYSYRRKGDTIQVKSNVTGYKAQAKCNPCDEFDLEKGIIICLLRIRLKELTR